MPEANQKPRAGATRLFEQMFEQHGS